jgi:hypothetical protein
MRSRVQLEIVLTGNSSWLPYAPQGIKGPDDNDTVYSVISNSLSNNVNEINISNNYASKHSFTLLKELPKRYFFNASLNLFVLPVKSLIAFGKGLYILILKKKCGS